MVTSQETERAFLRLPRVYSGRRIHLLLLLSFKGICEESQNVPLWIVVTSPSLGVSQQWQSLKKSSRIREISFSNAFLPKRPTMFSEYIEHYEVLSVVKTQMHWALFQSLMAWKGGLIIDFAISKWLHTCNISDITYWPRPNKHNHVVCGTTYHI